MRKIKIFITIFLLYEFIVASVLQIPTYCNALFNYNFCVGGAFKYFLLCVMFPGLVGLVIWWTPDIARVLCSKKCESQPDTTLKNMFNEIISKQDIEKFITFAIITWVRKFVRNHPDTAKKIDDVFNVLKNIKSADTH